MGYLTESMHGAGSPQAQRIMISRLADLKGKQKKAKRTIQEIVDMPDRKIDLFICFCRRFHS